MYSEDDDVVDPQKPESSFQPKLLGVNPGSNEKVHDILRYLCSITEKHQ